MENTDINNSYPFNKFHSIKIEIENDESQEPGSVSSEDGDTKIEPFLSKCNYVPKQEICDDDESEEPGSVSSSDEDVKIIDEIKHESQIPDIKDVKHCHSTLNTISRHTKDHSKVKLSGRLRSLELHSIRLFPCQSCQKMFKSKGGRNYHMITAHTAFILTKNFEVKPSKISAFICDYCGKASKTKHLLKQHFNIHLPLKRWKCEECGIVFKTLDALCIHSSKHEGSRDYVCKNCDKGFHTKHALKQHQKSHWNRRDHKCPECPLSFKTPYNLKSHLITHLNL